MSPDSAMSTAAEAEGAPSTERAWESFSQSALIVAFFFTVHNPSALPCTT
ncbi:MAG: hypothetical protein ACP5VR_10660 [Acidimicrobiales bacterium]